VKRDEYTKIKISILRTFFSRTGSRLSPPEIKLLLSLITGERTGSSADYHIDVSNRNQPIIVNRIVSDSDSRWKRRKRCDIKRRNKMQISSRMNFINKGYMYIKISDIAIYAGGCSKVEKCRNGVYTFCAIVADAFTFRSNAK